MIWCFIGCFVYVGFCFCILYFYDMIILILVFYYCIYKIKMGYLIFECKKIYIYVCLLFYGKNICVYFLFLL